MLTTRNTSPSRSAVKRLATLSLVVVHVLVVAASQLLHLWQAADPADAEITSLIWLGAYSLIIILFSYGFGFPEMSDSSQRIRNALVVCFAAPAGFAALQFVTGANRIPRVTFLTSIPLIALANYFLSIFISRRSVLTSTREPVIVIASSNDSNTLRMDQSKHSEVDFFILDTLLPDQPDLVSRVEDRLRISSGILVVDDSLFSNETLVAAIFELHLRGLRVRSMSQFYEEFLGKVSLHHLSSAALLSDIRQRHDRFYRLITRSVDLLVALICVLLMVPLSAIVWVGNKFGNRGSLFFKQTRIGFDNKPFDIIKFRTMKEGSSNTEWTQIADSRITRFGSLLRTTHLDELPQCLNILRGNISLVGPRPEQAHYVEQLAKVLPFYNVRHRVTPGLTGWAQVNYPYGSTEADAFQKLQFELWYIRQQSISLNLKIMVRTIRHLLRRGGR